jgi:uncharacterized protein with predicted RNA binding PUA domain
MTTPFDDADRLRTIADYQFGAGAGAALFPADGDPTVRRSASGRPRQILAPDGDRLVTLGADGRCTLGLAGGRRLARAFDPPRQRVVVGAESVPYVREGRNAFAKFVTDADPELRPGDETLVVHDDALLGVGRVELPAAAMADFERGEAVMLRVGAAD